MQESSKTKTIVIIIIAIIIVSAIGYFVWQSIGPTGISPISGWKTYLGFQAPAPTTPPTTPKTPAIQEIIWQTYNNAKYGYSLNYPDNWFLESANAEGNLINNVGGDLIISSKRNPLDVVKAGNPPADLATMTFVIYQVGSKTTIDQFIKDRKYATPQSQAALSYADLDGKQMIYTQSNQAKQVLNIVTILKQNTKMYVFSWSSFITEKDKLPPEVGTIHDELIKSFKVE